MVADRKVLLTGAITVETAHTWVDRYPAGSGDVVINMGGVTESDSALIALLVGWWRRAEREGVAIRIEQPPAAVLQLAQIYGVDSLLFS